LFTRLTDVADHRANSERRTGFANQRQHDAADFGRDFNRRLVRLDLGNHVAGVDLVADFLRPVEQDTLGHI